MLGNKFKTLYQPSYVDDGLPGQARSADLGPPLVGQLHGASVLRNLITQCTAQKCKHQKLASCGTAYKADSETCSIINCALSNI